MEKSCPWNSLNMFIKREIRFQSNAEVLHSFIWDDCTTIKMNCQSQQKYLVRLGNIPPIPYNVCIPNATLFPLYCTTFDQSALQQCYTEPLSLLWWVRRGTGSAQQQGWVLLPRGVQMHAHTHTQMYIQVQMTSTDLYPRTQRRYRYPPVYSLIIVMSLCYYLLFFTLVYLVNIFLTFLELHCWLRAC
jgi:hypothetical protein